MFKSNNLILLSLVNRIFIQSLKSEKEDNTSSSFISLSFQSV